MDPTNANTALASALVEELARGGLRHAVVSPGSRSTPLAVAFWRQAEIEVTVIVNERSAAFFALGAAQASGAPVALLCTSGTAAANYHPAICEADESALPLVVLTADRPPELRGIGAGQTIDQVKLYGDSVRWFCEVGTHDADDDGLLHYRSVACRAVTAARGEPRAGPVHLNLPWREPLAPVPIEGAVTATDPLALSGRGDRPLTAVTSIDLEPTAFLLDEVAGHIADAEAGVIVAGRQFDPELREPLARLARASGFPILAEPTSQLRCGRTTARGWSRPTTCCFGRRASLDRSRPTSFSASVRCRPASRCGGGWQRAEPIRSSSTRAGVGTSRASEPRRFCAPTRPSLQPAGLRDWRRKSGRRRGGGSRPRERHSRRSP